MTGGLAQGPRCPIFAYLRSAGTRTPECDNRHMTALFAGLTTLDVVHRLDHTPDPGLKVTSTDFTMAAGGPATNAAVTYAALSAAARKGLWNFPTCH